MRILSPNFNVFVIGELVGLVGDKDNNLDQIVFKTISEYSISIPCRDDVLEPWFVLHYWAEAENAMMRKL